MPTARASFSKKKVDFHQEQLLLAGMIMDERFLREVRSIYNTKHLKNNHVRIVAEWCLDYYTRYETCPSSNIETFYHTAMRDGMEDADAQAIGKFIENINAKAAQGHFENFNVEHALDEVEAYFKLQATIALKEDLDSYIRECDPNGAEECISNWARVERPKSTGVNPFTDENLILSAFAEAEEPLYKFPGAAGELVNEYLIRGAFVGIMGMEKSGKSWCLQEHAMRAAAARLNVAFFATGDMNEKEMALRKAIYIAQRSNVPKYCGKIHLPVLDCARNQCNSCRMPKRACRVGLLNEDGTIPQVGAVKGYVPCAKCADMPGFEGAVWYTIRDKVDPLTGQEAVKLNRWWSEVRMKNREYKMCFSPAGSINVDKINSQLSIWCYMDNWTPDVIIIDYADILEPEPGDGKNSVRDQQNGNWKALRRLSQEWHALVITATQTDAASYDQGLLRRKNFSEDKRKYGHSTVTIGLNQTPQEQTAGLQRWNVIMARAGEYNEFKTATILRSLQIGRPFLDSFWTPQQYEESDEES